MTALNRRAFVTVAAGVIAAGQAEQGGRAVDDDEADVLRVARVRDPAALVDLEAKRRERRHRLPEPGRAVRRTPLSCLTCSTIPPRTIRGKSATTSWPT